MTAYYDTVIEWGNMNRTFCAWDTGTDSIAWYRIGKRTRCGTL